MTKRKSRARRPRPDAAGGIAVTMVRLAVGAISLGSETVARRFVTISDGAAEGLGPEADGRRGFTAGGLIAGAAIETTEMAVHVVTAAAGQGRRVLAPARHAAHIPLVGAVTRPLRNRSTAAWRRVAARGRREQLVGRRMVQQLIRNATAQSVADLTQVAVDEVTHSPEVAAMLRSQSAGIATESILEVRTQSEQADDRLEQRIHSWLHIRET